MLFNYFLCYRKEVGKLNFRPDMKFVLLCYIIAIVNFKEKDSLIPERTEGGFHVVEYIINNKKIKWKLQYCTITVGETRWLKIWNDRFSGRPGDWEFETTGFPGDPVNQIKMNLAPWFLVVFCALFLLAMFLFFCRFL